MKFYGFIKSEKRFLFVICSFLKDSAFTAVKRDAKFETRYVKGVHLSIEGIRKEYLFCKKMVYKRVRGRTSERSLQV